MKVLLLNGNALGVNSAEVRIVEEADEEGFAGFLKGHDGGALPAQTFQVSDG